MEIIIIHESVVQSWMRDASTYALFAGLIGTGRFIGSPTLEFVGCIVGFTTILIRASGNRIAQRLTVKEARAELDRIESALSTGGAKP